jgi:hypothetical protein
MNRDEILRVLYEVTGDARGVDADDILLGHLRALPSEEKRAYWTTFGATLFQLWQTLAGTEGDHALDKVASFVARLPEGSVPENAEAVAGFLLDDAGITPNADHPERWQRISSALRVLTHLGLGSGGFWKDQLKFWMETGIVTQANEYRQAALDALVQAVRGVVATEGMEQQDFARLFNVALEAVDFPAIEVYSALVEETRKEREQVDFRPEALTQGIRKALADFLAAPLVSSIAPGNTHIAELRQVVNAWLKDEFGREPLGNRQPANRRAPWDELSTAHGRTARASGASRRVGSTAPVQA